MLSKELIHMIMFNIKEEALANAAKNKSSEQVSLVWNPARYTTNLADEQKHANTEQIEEKSQIVADSGSTAAENHLEIISSLIDKELGNIEEKMTRRMKDLVEEGILGNSRMIVSKSMMKEQRKCDCEKYPAKFRQLSRKGEDMKILIGKM